MENLKNENFLIEEMNSNKSLKWLTISRGLIIEKVDENTPGAKKRINKLNNEVYEKFYKKVGLVIKNIWIEEGVYGKQIMISFNLNEDNATLTINNDSSYGRSFYQQIFNCDLSKQIVIHPYRFEDDKGKTRTGVTIYQNGTKVEKQFPTDTPEVEFTEKNNKYFVNQIQQEERMEFLEKELTNFASKNNVGRPDFIKNKSENVDIAGTVRPENSKKTDSDFDFDDF